MVLTQPSSFIELKDECPYPDLYWGERPHSIIIEMSQFDTALTTNTTRLLSLLRDQYPQGISVSHRMIKKFNNRSARLKPNGRRDPQAFIEIGFADDLAREEALKSPLIVSNRTIHASKTLENNVYRIEIFNIDRLNDPSKHYDEVLKYLNQHGTVSELHLHYAKAANWFTGEGCAIWIDTKNTPNGNFGFYKHPKLAFSVQTYKVNENYNYLKY